MGSVFSAIGGGITALIGAIAALLTVIVSGITMVIVSIFNCGGKIICCRFGSRQKPRSTNRTIY